MIRIVIDQVSMDGTVQALGGATVANISDLAPISDYAVHAEEHTNHVARRSGWQSRGMIAGHDRQQTVWRLVERVAAWAAQEAEER